MPTIRTAAKSNPAMGALVTVHDMITGKGKKNNKAKKDKVGGGFPAASGSEDFKQGKPIVGKGKKPKNNKDAKLEGYKQVANEAKQSLKIAQSMIKERTAKNKGTFKLPKVKFVATGRKVPGGNRIQPKSNKQWLEEMD